MKHKTTNTTKKRPWEIAWELRTYPARLPEAKELSRADVVFCLMMWMGMSKVDSYLTAYPQTKASRISIAAMATRKSQEEWVNEYLDALWNAERKNKIKFNIIV